MSLRSEFFDRIKVIVKPKEKSEVEQEKKYEGYDIVVVEDQIDGNTFICTKERLEDDKEYTSKISANNIEDGSQIVEYRLNALPAGRVCFGGYTDKECNRGKKIYSFADVWYKIYGEPLKNKKFTNSELLAMSQEIKEKLKAAKFTYIFSIEYKNNGFTSPRYFAGYLKNQETEIFEMIDDGSMIQTDGSSLDGNLTIKIGDEQIDVGSFAIANTIKTRKESNFDIKLIEQAGESKVYSKAKYTKEACKQIIKNYERGKGNEFSL